jgi:hypothetical protein
MFKNENCQTNNQKVEDKMYIDDYINTNTQPVPHFTEFKLENSIKINKERNPQGKTVLNRRKNKLDEMIKNGDDFFSEESIRERDVKFA